jgi:hypothetical protein
LRLWMISSKRSSWTDRWIGEAGMSPMTVIANYNHTMSRGQSTISHVHKWLWCSIMSLNIMKHSNWSLWYRPGITSKKSSRVWHFCLIAPCLIIGTADSSCLRLLLYAFQYSNAITAKYIMIEYETKQL